MESTASMIWTLTFLAYSSSTFLGELGTGMEAAWTVPLVALPAVLAGLDKALEGRRHAKFGLLKYVLYASVPAIIQFARPHESDKDGAMLALICDVLTIAALVLPNELKLLPELGATGTVSIWGTLTASLASVNTFVVLRPFEPPHSPIGYSFKLRPMDVVLSCAAACLLCVILIPLARTIGYGHVVRPGRGKPPRMVAIFLGQYFTALSEEIMFQGLILNMLEGRLGAHESVVPLTVASAMYAAASLKSKAQGFRKPNWRMAVLAFVSAHVYGTVWRQTGKVTASALTHGLVSCALKAFFEKPNLA